MLAALCTCKVLALEAKSVEVRSLAERPKNPTFARAKHCYRTAEPVGSAAIERYVRYVDGEWRRNSGRPLHVQRFWQQKETRLIDSRIAR